MTDNDTATLLSLLAHANHQAETAATDHERLKWRRVYLRLRVELLGVDS
jgi:hypothetical protein